ncbi:MAG TPA: hypothetical protein VMZ92_05460 [Planctomycetota bacterium]|nr:hypothetical protein [Planctomycetota bacterium]
MLIASTVTARMPMPGMPVFEMPMMNAADAAPIHARVSRFWRISGSVMTLLLSQVSF